MAFVEYQVIINEISILDKHKKFPRVTVKYYYVVILYSTKKIIKRNCLFIELLLTAALQIETLIYILVYWVKNNPTLTRVFQCICM